MLGKRTIILGFLALTLMFAPASAKHRGTNHAVPHRAMANAQLDRSGRKQIGRASYYGRHVRRQMADGARFNPNSNDAASRTLPLGTTAKVTNLKTGRSALIKVRDRGPLWHGRIVDVSPRVAGQVGMGKAGVAPVVVAPIAVPQSNGGVKLGAGAVEVSHEEVTTATRAAQAAAR